VDRLGDGVSGLRVCYLVEYAGNSRPGRAIALRNSSTRAIGRTNGREPERIGTELAEIDTVDVPAAPDLPPFALAEGPRGDVDCLQRSNACKDEHYRRMAARKQLAFRQGTDRRTHPHMRQERGVGEPAGE